jgi:AcrR family transcriptional regulator
MPRPRDEQRRADIAARVAAILLERGTTQLGLIDLARGTDESSRMLVHHFGSRDALISEAIGVARRQIVTTVRERLAGQGGDLGALVTTLRGIVSAPANRPYFQLFSEVSAIARHRADAFPGFGRASVHDWLGDLTGFLVRGGSDQDRAEAEATLALAIVRGLLLDENATAQSARVQAAYDVFADAHRGWLRLRS